MCKNIKFKELKTAKGFTFPLLDYIPEGWKPLKNASVQPLGYQWYWNGKSLFGGEYKDALIKIQDEK